MHLIVSTCGTSLLTNLAGNHRALVTRHANAPRLEDIPVEDRQILQKLIEQAHKRMLEGSNEDRAKLSAEYNGLNRFYGGEFATNDMHWLIATDTWMGQQTAKILEAVLGNKAQVKRIPGLRTDDLASFRLAMADLVKMCKQEIEPLRIETIFNLTGGFKSVQGMMQTLGMLYADETVYIFEGSNELLRLPRLPIHLEAEDEVRRALHAFRRLDVGLPLSSTDRKNIPEIFLLEIDGQIGLSEWGELVWQEVRDKLLSECLWPSVDDKLRYGPKFKRSVESCSKEELRDINFRLAELARHLNDPSYNPRHLDFKKLNVPRQGSTHECDAWARHGAKRLFGHFENDIFVADRLEEGLH